MLPACRAGRAGPAALLPAMFGFSPGGPTRTGKRQLHARIGDERSGPVETGEEVGHPSIMTEGGEWINARRAVELESKLDRSSSSS